MFCTKAGGGGFALNEAAVYKKPYFYCKLCENPYQHYKSYENLYQVLQVTCAASKRAMKSKVQYDKIIITIVPSYTGTILLILLSSVLLLVLHTHNNTDSNKLVIFSSIAWYYQRVGRLSM